VALCCRLVSCLLTLLLFLACLSLIAAIAAIAVCQLLRAWRFTVTHF